MVIDASVERKSFVFKRELQSGLPVGPITN